MAHGGHTWVAAATRPLIGGLVDRAVIKGRFEAPEPTNVDCLAVYCATCRKDFRMVLLGTDCPGRRLSISD